MFSRNRFNGQHGAGVTPKTAAKAKVHSPKKRAPNPKVALVIRGKIHRLLQGSTDHHVPEPHLYCADLEETEGEVQECSKGHRSLYPNHSPRPQAYSVSNGKGHRVPPGPPCVGEVELNREGCKRIPCTLQSKSRSTPANLKRISFKGEIQTSPEEKRAPMHYRPVGPDINGCQHTGASRKGFPAPCIRPKRPYSTGDCVDYNFNKTAPEMLLEEDEDKEEEESSAVIEHILKELRGINKIQEEISDLRDYLSSVRGSVDEVSSCVDAVLLEIEGIRCSNRAVSGVHPGTWSGVGCKDRQSPRKRPTSAYGSLESAIPKAHSNFLSHDHDKRHCFHAESLLPRAGEPTESPTAESLVHEELEDQEENSDHSSDIPAGALSRKHDFRYQDGQECLSTSSLSSGHSSKSEGDLEGPCCTRECKQEIGEEGGKHWTNREPLHGSTGESVWHGEPVYFRARSLEEHGDQSTLCCKETAHWDYYKDSAGYRLSRQGSTGSSERLSVRSGKRYNSPASTSSREDWQSRRRRPHGQSGVHDPGDTSFEAASECNAAVSYGESPDYPSGREAEVYNYVQSGELNYTHSQVDSYQENYPAFEDSTQETWADASLCTTEVDVGRPRVQESATGNHSLEGRGLDPDGADIQAGGFNVKRISQAVFDFSTALRGALRKLDVPAAQTPEEEVHFDLLMPYDLQENDEVHFEQTSEKFLKSIVKDYDHSVGELKKNNTLNELDRFSEEPLLEEASKSLNRFEFTDTYQFSDKIPDHLSSLPEPTRSTATLPPPDDLTEHPTEGPAEITGDKPAASQPPECTGAPTNLEEEPVEPAKVVQNDVPQQPVVEIMVPKEKEEEDAGESPVDLSQMDERKLKCLRTFQQILREKRETRRNLASVTMSTFSQEDFEPGSHH